MTNSKRTPSSFGKILSLTAGLALASSTFCVPAISFAAPPTPVAKSRSGFIKKAVIGGTAAVILGGTALYGIGTRNELVNDRETVRQSFSAVDVQLQRRADLLPNMAKAAKAFGVLEAKVFENVTIATKAMKSANTVEEKVAAGIQMNTAMGPFMMLQTTYPQLASDGHYSRLVAEMKGTEDRIMVARERYNDAVGAFNKKVVHFPTNSIAGMAGIQQMPYFKAKTEAQDVPNLEF